MGEARRKRRVASAVGVADAAKIPAPSADGSVTVELRPRTMARLQASFQKYTLFQEALAPSMERLEAARRDYLDRVSTLLEEEGVDEVVGSINLDTAKSELRYTPNTPPVTKPEPTPTPEVVREGEKDEA